MVIHQDLDLDVSLMFSLKVVTLTLMPSGLFRRLVRGMSEWLVRHRYFWSKINYVLPQNISLVHFHTGWTILCNNEDDIFRILLCYYIPENFLQ